MSTFTRALLVATALTSAFSATASAVPRPIAGGAGCVATIYEHSNYEGASQILHVGTFDMSTLSIGNDVLSSLKVSGNCTVTLFEHAGFQGSTKTISGDTTWIGDDWNDRVSSIRVESGRAQACTMTLYRDAWFEGPTAQLPAGRHDMSALGIGNDQLSSLKLSSGCTATLYEHAGFQGASRTVTSDVDWVGDAWNDRVSSIVVQ